MSMHTVFMVRGKRIKIPMRAVAPLLALLLLVGPFHIISAPTGGGQVQAQIGCDDVTYSTVIQDCVLRLSGFMALEQQAIDALLAAHQLPASDRGRLIGWERDAIRAVMFTSLVAIIEKDPAERTAVEQGMVDVMADLVQQRRIAAAQFSIDQYNAWDVSPCDYDAPDPYEYPYPTACVSPIAGAFDSPPPPTLEEFLAYGNAHIYADFQDGAAAFAAAATAARMLGLASGLVIAGIAGLVGAVIGASLTVTSTLILAIHPFLAAVVAKAAGVGVAAVAGTASAGVGAVAVGSIVGIVIAAIVIAVIQGISVFTAEAIPGQLQDNLGSASAPVNLSELLTTEEGVMELFAAFLLETIPDFPSQSPVPAQQPTDRTFVLTDPQGGKAGSQTLNYQCWNPVVCGSDVNHAARLSGGWFVSKNDTSGTERMTLGIDYIDWNGNGWTAWRVGPQEFLHTRTGDGSEPFVSEEIKFKTWDGAQFIATINAPPSTPGKPVADPAVNNGEFRLSWQAAIDVDGDPLTYTVERCNAFFSVEIDGVVTCSNQVVGSGIATTSYDFTGSERQTHGQWKYRVRASDGESSTAYSNFSSNVVVDRRPPAISFGSSAPPANSDGWNNSDVAFTWTCDDSPELEVFPSNSGVVDASISQTITSEGATQSATGTCVDNVGNSASHTVEGINIDKTAPVAAHTGPYETDEGTTITLDGGASNDAVSGIASTSWAADQDNVFDDGDPASFTPTDGPAVYDVKLRVEDLAGNVTEVTTTVTSSNAAPVIGFPVVVAAPSDEGAPVTASAGFSDAGAFDTHTCEIDWDDGTAPTVGTVSNKTCSGTHTYADDHEAGTASDDYSVSITVSDNDNANDQKSSSHTVNNVAPSIDAINVPSAVSHASMVPVSVDGSDAGGVHDPLTYAFDCDGDGSYETSAGSSNSVNCLPDQTTLSPTIGVQVTDDDLGITTDTVELYVEKNYCVNFFNGSLRDAVNCQSNEMPVTLRPDLTVLFCANLYTGALAYGSNGCGSGSMALSVPAAYPIDVCVNWYTGAYAYRFGRACGPSEQTLIIPAR